MLARWDCQFVPTLRIQRVRSEQSGLKSTVQKGMKKTNAGPSVSRSESQESGHNLTQLGPVLGQHVDSVVPVSSADRRTAAICCRVPKACQDRQNKVDNYVLCLPCKWSRG